MLLIKRSVATGAVSGLIALAIPCLLIGRHRAMVGTGFLSGPYPHPERAGEFMLNGAMLGGAAGTILGALLGLVLSLFLAERAPAVTSYAIGIAAWGFFGSLGGWQFLERSAPPWFVGAMLWGLGWVAMVGLWRLAWHVLDAGRR